MVKRDRCSRCGFVVATCLCHCLSPQSLSARVIVIQDRLEQRQAKSTVPLLQLALPALEVIAGDDLAALEELARSRSDSWGLVYPGPGAVPVDVAPAVPWPDTWVLLDGTWRKTRRLLVEQAWLQDLPRYSFTMAPESQYRIRKGPGQGALSTLESVAWLLSHVSDLDPDPLYRLQAEFVAQWQGFQPKAHRRP